MSLEPWPHYDNLKHAQKLDAECIKNLTKEHFEWSQADTTPRIVSLRQLHHLRHAGKGLVLVPAYAQTNTIYEAHRIITVDNAKVQQTNPTERLNQFDGLGATYREDLDDIYIEYRLGCIVSDAAAYASEYVRVATDSDEQSNVALLVIDGLRTVDAAYALAAGNPEAIANKLLTLPGKSAHNKGMAVDLTLVYWSVEHGCWMDADMLGHMDHPDMVTNHRDYTDVSVNQRHNRLQLERIMLRSALLQGTLLAPLREEFWDFRFPEDGLDFWRVLESVARIIDDHAAKKICAEAITHIHELLRAGNRTEAYESYDMTIEDFARVWQELFESETSQLAIKELLGIQTSAVSRLRPITHGHVNVLYDADLPPSMQQSNPKLKYLFA